VKSWKSSWKKELDDVVPQLRDDVKNAAIPCAVNVVAEGGVAVMSPKKKSVLIVAAVLILCVIVVSMALFIPRTPTERLFTVEINPLISVSADKNGVVTGVISGNADADAVLTYNGTEQTMIGKNVTDAINVFVDCAAKMGYLDLSSYGSAVRVSTNGESANMLSNVRNKLTSYMQEKGIYGVVVADITENSELIQRCGINAQSLSDVISQAVRGETLYYNRMAANLSQNELSEAYRDLLGLTESHIGTRIIDDLTSLKNSVQDVAGIYDLNVQIISNPDNPALVLKDYWRVKSQYGENFDGEFGELMKQMRIALADYGRQYGLSIEDYTQLIRIRNISELIPLDRIADLLINVSVNKIAELAQVLSEIADVVDLFPKYDEFIVVSPKDFKEFKDKAKNIFNDVGKDRTNKYSDVYNAPRPTVSENEYGDYINGIEAKYGSLQNYWNSLN